MSPVVADVVVGLIVEFVVLSNGLIYEGGSLGIYYLIVGLLAIISDIFYTGSIYLKDIVLLRVYQGFGGICFFYNYYYYYDVLLCRKINI